MEKTFALVNVGIVENLIIAPSLEIAQEVAPGFDVVEATGNPDAYIGGEYQNGAFVPRPVVPVEPVAP